MWRWIGHVARIIKNTAFHSKNLKGRDHVIYIAVGPVQFFSVHAKKAGGGMDLELLVGEWSPSGPVRFTLGVNFPTTHRLHGLVGFRIGVDDSERQKISYSSRQTDHDFWVFQPVA
jgi:hypothetical protein